MTGTSWQMRIAGGLAAHFHTDEGDSLPGTEWAVGLRRGEERYTVRVRSLLARDASAATRRDEEYQARTTMEYLDDRLRGGWHPSEEVAHEIRIGDPLGGHAPAARPWWRFW
jgi:hypothetical protein